MQPFDYVRPQTLEEASQVLARANGTLAADAPRNDTRGGVCILAGGTELLPRLEAGLLSPSIVVDIKELPGLTDLCFSSEEGLDIGAAVVLRRLAGHPDVRRTYGLFLDVYDVMGSPPIRNRATVGGNLCNASPAADLAPSLLCYDAACRVYGPAGERVVPLEHFFVGPKQTILGPGELLIGLRLPPPVTRHAGIYQKLRLAKGGHIGLVGVAVWVGLCANQWCWRIALGAVGPRPFRAYAAERFLQHETNPGSGPIPAGVVAEAAALAQEATQPIDDLRASAAYRRAMVGVLVSRGIESTLARLAGGTA